MAQGRWVGRVGGGESCLGVGQDEAVVDLENAGGEAAASAIRLRILPGCDLVIISKLLRCVL